MIGGLNDRILLSMYAAAKFMIFTRGDIQFLSQTSCFKTMFDAGRRTIITRR